MQRNDRIVKGFKAWLHSSAAASSSAVPAEADDDPFGSFEDERKPAAAEQLQMNPLIAK